MTEKHDELCENCGYDEEAHNKVVDPRELLKNKRGAYYPPCKKFIAKNHTPASQLIKTGQMNSEDLSARGREKEGTQNQEEFNLSEKIKEYEDDEGKLKLETIDKEDVKIFIRNCEEDIIEHRNIAQYKHPESKVIIALSNEIINIIRKRAGDKLT